jgi:type I site-specific restriction endonuclease
LHEGPLLKGPNRKYEEKSLWAANFVNFLGNMKKKKKEEEQEEEEALKKLTGANRRLDSAKSIATRLREELREADDYANFSYSTLQSGLWSSANN